MHVPVRALVQVEEELAVLERISIFLKQSLIESSKSLIRKNNLFVITSRCDDFLFLERTDILGEVY